LRLQLPQPKQLLATPVKRPVPKSEFVEGMAYQVSADSVYAEVRFQGNTKLVFPLQSRAMHFRPHDFIMGYEFGGTLEASAFYGEMPIADVVVANPPFARFELSFKYEALVSARIDKGQLVSWHVDEVRLTGVRE